MIFLGAKTGRLSSVIFKSRAFLRIWLSYSPRTGELTLIGFLTTTFFGYGKRGGEVEFQGDICYLVVLLMDDCEPFSKIWLYLGKIGEMLKAFA